MKKREHDFFVLIIQELTWLTKFEYFNLLIEYFFFFICTGSISAAPENITVTFLNPTSVKISWQTSVDQHAIPVDKYDVTYKPTDAR